MITLLINGAAYSQEWSQVSLIGEDVKALAIQQNNSAEIFAGTGSNFSTQTSGKLYRYNVSDNQLDTIYESVSVSAIESNSVQDSIIYVGLVSANMTQAGIIRSNDYGETWNWADEGIELDPESSVISLKIDPTNSQYAYAGIGGFYGGAAYGTANAGSLWVNIGDIQNGEIPDEHISAFAVDPEQPNIVYVGTLGYGYILKSLNRGADWTIIFDEGMMERGCVDIVIDPTNTQRIWAVFQGNGIYRSDDGGGSWIESNDGISDLTTRDLDLDANDPNHLVLASGLKVYESFDGGVTWMADSLYTSVEGPYINTVMFSAQTDLIICGMTNGLWVRDVITERVDHSVSHYPTSFELKSATPNPFNHNTSIPIHFYQDEQLSVSIVDLTGSIRFEELISGRKDQGFLWSWPSLDHNSTYFNSGIYIIQIKPAGSLSFTTVKVCLIK